MRARRSAPGRGGHFCISPGGVPVCQTGVSHARARLDPRRAAGCGAVLHRRNSCPPAPPRAPGRAARARRTIRSSSAQSSRMRFHKRSGSRVRRFTGNDLEHNRSLLALPYPQLFTRVAVGQAGLAEHGMLIGDALGWCFVDLETGFQPAPLHRV